MQTRLAIESDLSSLSGLFDAYRQFYGQAPDADGARSFVQERLAHGDSTLLVAVDAGDLVGFTQLYPSFSSVSMRRLYILNDLFVTPRSRGQGIGSSLLRAAARYGEEQGAVRLTLATAVTNRAAQRLYESLGWGRDEAFLHYNLQPSA